MREGCVEMDAAFHVLFANPAAALLFGRPLAELPGRTPAELLPPDSADRLRRHLEDMMRTGRPAAYEDGWTDPPRQIALRSQPSASGLLLFLKDVSALRRAEQTLASETEHRRMVEEWFESALSVNRLVVFKLDRQLRYSWVYNNQVSVRDLDAVGRTPDAFFDAASAARLSAFFHSVIDSGKARRGELALHLRTTGQDRHFITSARPVSGPTGEVVGLTGASIDITNVVRQREQLSRAREEADLAKAEAERASLAKSKFLAAASHDLRQPVQSLLLLISLLQHELRGSPALRVVEQMNAAVDALRLLFDSMLDVSRLDAGIIVPTMQVLSVGDLLLRLAEEYRLRAKEQGLGFRLVPTSARLRTDPLLLERILRNLMENALRYTESGRLLVGCRRLGDRLSIQVIEDDPIQRDSLSLMLQNWGYRVESDASGEAALERAAGSARPDAIIADLRLGGALTGPETALRICARLGQPLPILIVTGDTAPERVREVLASGCRILHKPVGAEELRRALASMLQEQDQPEASG